MCARCDHVRAHVYKTVPAPTLEHRLAPYYIEADIAAASLWAWFGTLAVRHFRFEDVPLDELRDARAHAERIREQLDMFLARRSS